MTAGAQARRAAGAIVIGRVRDVVEHRAAGFPLFALGRSTLPQRAFTRVAAVGCPLDIPMTTGAAGEEATLLVHIKPGDWMVGDEDGVVCVPREMVERVVQRASAAREVDERCLKDIKDGLGVRESFRKHRGK
jgi:regulator of RNase E activity RraA